MELTPPTANQPLSTVPSKTKYCWQGGIIIGS